VATAVQQALMTQSFRVYTNSDVVGAELGGALKNIIALGAGMGDGLDVGENAKAAFITRGLAEMGRLGLAMGAHPLTFAGLAGLGDLIATCASRQSRNRHVGEELAKGRSLGDIQRSMVSVAEGVPTTVVARELARQQDVEMPITNMMYQVLFEGKPPRDAINELMTREPRSEASG
jgi:glycerol-3-phosphate dehydrogenase (NAD(P)+)